MNKIPLPEAFLERMKSQLGESEFADFLTALEDDKVVSLRENPKKATSQFESEESIPWSSEGKYLQERPDFVKDPLIFAGSYYVQEASSQFLEHIFEQVLDLQNPLKVLDLCAAPGGKSTLLSSILSEDSLLVSNELVTKRSISLMENLVRWGNSNTLVTGNNSADFTPITDFFDAVVVDAPCSGEGMFRKDPKTIRVWSENLVATCAIQQKTILAEIAPSIKPNGILIYSTCTYNEQENEENLKWLAEKGEFESVRINLSENWGITETVTEVDEVDYFGYRFYPHKVRGEGFFISCFRKKDFGNKPKKVKIKKRETVEMLPKKYLNSIEPWLESPEKLDYFKVEENVFVIPKNLSKDYKFLVNFLNIRLFGVDLGKFGGKKLIPSHQLAMSHLLSAKISKIELDYEQAVNYLRKLEVEVETNVKSWAIVTYQNQQLGWIKVLPNRINNYYPMELRLKKEF